VSNIQSPKEPASRQEHREHQNKVL